MSQCNRVLVQRGREDLAKHRSRRQRKKLRIGEFQELGFSVFAELASPLNALQRDTLIDVFLEKCIEPNGMLFGGGINRDLEGYVVANSARGSANEQQRECVRAWLAGRSEFSAVTVGPLVDAWYGHD